jgi:hypothetical protein
MNWRLPQHYTTILLGDIDRHGGADLVAHGAKGLETYRWHEETYQWVKLGVQRLAASESLDEESSFPRCN